MLSINDTRQFHNVCVNDSGNIIAFSQGPAIDPNRERYGEHRNRWGADRTASEGFGGVEVYHSGDQSSEFSAIFQSFGHEQSDGYGNNIAMNASGNLLAILTAQGGTPIGNRDNPNSGIKIDVHDISSLIP